jgi:hypothetical protein
MNAGIWTSLGTSISALAVATWTMVTWYVAEKPKYDPVMKVFIAEHGENKAELWSDNSGICKFYMYVTVKNAGLSTVRVNEVDLDFAFVPQAVAGEGITRVDYFSALNDEGATHIKLDGQAGHHSPFIHSYPPGDDSNNGLSFIIPRSLVEAERGEVFVYRARAWTNRKEADDNAFSWGTLPFEC